MANDQSITILGNLTNDPELRFTPNGSAVANFTVARTPKSFDKRTNESKDGETLFLRCAAWGEMAENVAESLTKGTRVTGEGFLEARSYETKEGEKRTVMEVRIQTLGPDLRWASAKVTRTQRSGGGSGFNQAPQQPQQQWGGQQQAAPAEDPWATPANSQQQAWGNGPDSNNPPF